MKQTVSAVNFIDTHFKPGRLWCYNLSDVHVLDMDTFASILQVEPEQLTEEQIAGKCLKQYCI